MKYTAKQEQAGTWFVNIHKVAGVQRGHRFDTEQEAKEFALQQSHIYYQEQMNKAYDELKKICPQNSIGEIKLTGYDYFTNQGDLMA